ncbi:LCP family protein [uncultured Clostridium sp.]|uniref:LCP family protein n=1 Tax=uncultured Clostridium sp. TaxID=59620 RepID=UPI00263A121F|nr:LCP family protein [uncultured Clostridium sp.]
MGSRSDRNREDREMKRNNKASLRSKIIIGVVISILGVIGMAGGYVYALFSQMDRVDIDKESLGANQELTDEYGHIKNIALFGVDNADGGGGRSDAIMVATLDTKNKKIKVTSFMRDSYVEIPGKGGDKLNAAYAYGQEELAMKTLNQNFDLNIEDFVTVDFSSLPKVIDEIGGVEINITGAELGPLNQYIRDSNKKLGTNVSGVSSTGLRTLNGVQAMTYCRIRSTVGDDFKRTERQRVVIDAMLEKILNMSVTRYPRLLNAILPMVKTTLSTGDILDMGTDVVSIGNNLEQGRFPMDGDYTAETIRGMSCLTFDKEVTQKKVHEWIFGVNEN